MGFKKESLNRLIWPVDRFPVIGHLLLEPSGNQLNDSFLVLRINRDPHGDLVPLMQAGPATGCRRVLGDKNRMSPHRGLLAVVFRLGAGQAGPDEITGVTFDGFESLLGKIPFGVWAKAETTAEPAGLESFQGFLEWGIHE